jgi:hypothetical protein
MWLHIENGDRGQSYETQTQFSELNMVYDSGLLSKLVLEWQLHVSFLLNIAELYVENECGFKLK